MREGSVIIESQARSTLVSRCDRKGRSMVIEGSFEVQSTVQSTRSWRKLKLSDYFSSESSNSPCTSRKRFPSRIMANRNDSCSRERTFGIEWERIESRLSNLTSLKNKWSHFR